MKMLERILINLFLCLFTIYTFKKIKNGLHMLQLESYKNERYFKWIKNNINKTIKISEILLTFVYIILMVINKGLLALIFVNIIYGILILKTKYPQQKKPFVITNRIKRMYVTQIIILIILAITVNIKPNIVIPILMAFTIASYYLVIIINKINEPIEKSIQKKFYKQAQNKLKQMPNLKVVRDNRKLSVKQVQNT